MTAFVPVVGRSGISATFSVGSLSVVDMQVGLTGQSITTSVGSITVNDMTIGLTGQSFTASQGTAKAPNETAILSGVSITSFHKELHKVSSSRSTINWSIFYMLVWKCYNTK